MSKANICLTRAGASTLAELVFLNLPFVAVPLLTAKDNHQFENAFFYKEIGCNWILNQNEIDEITITNMNNQYTVSIPIIEILNKSK